MKNLVKLCCCLLLLFGCGDDSIQEINEPIIENKSLGNWSIMVVSHNTLDSDYLAFTRRNHQAYVKRQGYDYWFRNGTIDNGKFANKESTNKLITLGLYWQKVTAVEDALNLVKADGSRKYDWVVWIDADAFFTNMSKRFDEIIAKAKPADFFLIAKDYPASGCVNAGVFLIKNNEQGRNFIKQLADNFDLYKWNAWPEQDALEDMIYQYVDQHKNEQREGKKRQGRRICDPQRIIDGVGVLPQQTMNAFYRTGFWGESAWQPGDFIAHMAGADNKVQLAKRLMPCLEAQGDNAVGCEPDGTWRAPAP